MTGQPDARSAILARIRANTVPANGPDLREVQVNARLKAHPRGILPALPIDDPVAMFRSKAEAASASVDVITSRQAGAAILKWLRDHNLPQALRMGKDARLHKIDWKRRNGPEILHGPSDGNDLVGLSHALGGIAETGTLLLASGPDNPTSINFLPENHIVVLNAADIEANHEPLWTKIRRKYGAGRMPRTINMITGPSRSADIEQTLILGAHGPVRLHIIILKDSGL
ncbi:MAG: LUD domain-containing protein [Rhizobiaceae bacterium]